MLKITVLSLSIWVANIMTQNPGVKYVYGQLQDAVSAYRVHFGDLLVSLSVHLTDQNIYRNNTRSMTTCHLSMIINVLGKQTKKKKYHYYNLLWIKRSFKVWHFAIFDEKRLNFKILSHSSSSFWICSFPSFKCSNSCLGECEIFIHGVCQPFLKKYINLWSTLSTK